MKTQFVFCLLLVSLAWSQAPAQDTRPNEIVRLARELRLEIEADTCEPRTTTSAYKRISLVAENEPLDAVLRNITAKCGTIFVFTDNTLSRFRVSANFTNAYWKLIITDLLTKTGLEIWQGDLLGGVALIGTKESLSSTTAFTYIGPSGICLRSELVAPFNEGLAKRMSNIFTRFGSGENERGSLLVTDSCDRIEIISRYALRGSKQGYSFSELMSAYETDLAK